MPVRRGLGGTCLPPLHTTIHSKTMTKTNIRRETLLAQTTRMSVNTFPQHQAQPLRSSEVITFGVNDVLNLCLFTSVDLAANTNEQA